MVVALLLLVHLLTVTSRLVHEESMEKKRSRGRSCPVTRTQTIIWKTVYSMLNGAVNVLWLTGHGARHLGQQTLFPYSKSRIFRMLFISYISYAAAFVRKCHAYECDATVSFTLKISGCTKMSCVRKVGGPQHTKFSAYEIFWIYSFQKKKKNHKITKNFDTAVFISL